jgi:hypothetical protein
VHKLGDITFRVGPPLGWVPVVALVCVWALCVAVLRCGALWCSAPLGLATVDERVSLDNLVGEWLTVPGLAELLGTTPAKVRNLVRDRRIVGIRLGEPPVFQIPRQFVIIDPDLPDGGATVGGDAGSAGGGLGGDSPAGDAADDGAVARAEQFAVHPALYGTIVVLGDVGLTDEQIIEWLFTPLDDLGQTPMAALLAGRKTRVRQIAQVLG